MAHAFDWNLIDLPCWTPLSQLGVVVERIQDEFFEIEPGIYVMANSDFGGTVEDPGVGAVLWARSRAAALRIYDQRRAIVDTLHEGSTDRPPVSVMGFGPLTYAVAFDFEKRRGAAPMVAADYRFSDGAFLASRISVVGREYIFASVNPAADEEPVGVRFNLPISK